MGGRPCKVCIHPQLAEINKAILKQGGSKAGIARRFVLTESCVQRHRANCLDYRTREKKTAPAVERNEGSEKVRFDHRDPESLVKTTARLVDDALALLENAKKVEDNRTALGALKEARDGLRLLMQNAGMLAGDGVTIDARRQTIQLFDGLTTDELRRLANGDGALGALPGQRS